MPSFVGFCVFVVPHWSTDQRKRNSSAGVWTTPSATFFHLETNSAYHSDSFQSFVHEKFFGKINVMNPKRRTENHLLKLVLPSLGWLLVSRKKWKQLGWLWSPRWSLTREVCHSITFFTPVTWQLKASKDPFISEGLRPKKPELCLLLYSSKQTVWRSEILGLQQWTLLPKNMTFSSVHLTIKLNNPILVTFQVATE